MTDGTGKKPSNADGVLPEVEPLVRSEYRHIRSASGYFEPPFHHPVNSTPTAEADTVVQTKNGNAPKAQIEEETMDDHKRSTKSNAKAAYSTCRYFSCLYALVVIVLSAAFPLAEIISLEIRPLFYESFYLYLYGVSLLFLIFAYGFLFQSGRRQKVYLISWARRNTTSSSISRHHDNQEDPYCDFLSDRSHASSSGSFYLRLGAMIFGVGAMLYSVLEFGQYFEIPFGSHCDDILTAITPAARFVFSFAQLYLVFLNSKIRTDRYNVFASFGFMHMFATNISVWLSVLIEETKHQFEISIFEPEKLRPPGIAVADVPEMFFSVKPFASLRANVTAQGNFTQSSRISAVPNKVQHRLQSYLSGIVDSLVNISNEYEASCRSTTTVGSIMQQASPFLYPCIVENSLICAALLYMMWSGLKHRRFKYNSSTDADNKNKHQFSVNCHNATRGLFLGLLMVVMTIMSMVLFFVWIRMTDYYTLAIFQAYVMECILYTTSTLAVCVAFVRINALKYKSHGSSRIDDNLLIISQMGVYVFPVFVLISGHHTIMDNPTKENISALVCAGLEIIQSTLQTLFLLDATRRRPNKQRHVDDKPGREMVTFLLVCNFSFWAVDSLEAWRHQLYPIQIRFYGIWTWTLITHVSMPLLIFYRFHSSVCLSEVWKNAYKIKSPAIKTKEI
ncbi:proton channel OtopLc-like isoform X2 [Paramacrobiotus metropolitanus]|uniref:proton channel OtopLc-like isoform X2 n=1 Tax=Paramacrobiotus metropolitanus TaxID=2943436 RepID=UPI0024460257|nr:proton channel OtopLc-like isoform X2 [Paramacrobiotus metropolitanus]